MLPGAVEFIILSSPFPHTPIDTGQPTISVSPKQSRFASFSPTRNLGISLGRRHHHGSWMHFFDMRGHHVPLLLSCHILLGLALIIPRVTHSGIRLHARIWHCQFSPPLHSKPGFESKHWICCMAHLAGCSIPIPSKKIEQRTTYACCSPFQVPYQWTFGLVFHTRSILNSLCFKTSGSCHLGKKMGGATGRSKYLRIPARRICLRQSSPMS
jgi:hypothetical protein